MRPPAIAIVGMAGRFPGARNVREFWKNLRDGVESIRSLPDSELMAGGATREELASPDYVKRAAVLEDVGCFDAEFFGMSPKDAEIMDPQHRHFLECAWEAMEDAALLPSSFKGSIGVFAGSGMNSYLIHNLLANRELVKQVGLFQLKQTGNDKDVLATRASYQFDLRGPSINVQTACSTSLVAVHLASQSLLNHECDLALAGGVTIEIPHGQGYMYREGEILSRDGHCRAFDAGSTGTVFGSGVGIVVLRRLEDALSAGDPIRAVILGSAVNNDGARKVGYFAPSVEGQADVIAEALEFAGVSADDISYVEAHGTGTSVGDPIEVRALTRAFQRSTNRLGFCAIGSVKTNVGHLDAASGVAALIKTVLALEHAQLPASLHFQRPNPHLEFADSPFFVNSRLAEWSSHGAPRRAGVTSLGIGGTNAHLILEEAPPSLHSQPSKPYCLMTVSAKTGTAAEVAAANLRVHLDEHLDVNLQDASFTCQLGRQAFAHRRAWVANDARGELAEGASRKHGSVATGVAAAGSQRVVFLFSGEGAQYVDMGRELYEDEPVYREALDSCAKHLSAFLDIDLRRLLYPDPSRKAASAAQLCETWVMQPALFAVEYALALWWVSLGVEPAAMAGHGIGEYVAACISGVFSLEDALAVIALRGKLAFGLPAGAMLAVQLAADALHLNHSLSLAAVNGSSECIVSGPVDEINRLEQDLAMQSVSCRRLATSHAFHSAMMDPIVDVFEDSLRSISLHPPCIPLLSCISGTWIREDEATDPAYWARHLRNTVRFSDCIAELGREPDQVLLEVGPGNMFSNLALLGGARANTLSSLPGAHEAEGGLAHALHTVGELWTRGAHVNWEALHLARSARRISLPTYPFEHKRFWVEPDSKQQFAWPAQGELKEAGKDLTYYRRVWKLAPIAGTAPNASDGWIIFMDGLGLGKKIAEHLEEQGHHAVLVDPGLSYMRTEERRYRIRPDFRDDYDSLIADVRKSGILPGNVVHLWPLAAGDGNELLNQALERCFFSPLFLAQAAADAGLEHVDVAFISGNMQRISDEPANCPARSVLLGPARVIPLELPEVACRSIDVDLRDDTMVKSAASILEEMRATNENAAVAYRGGERFVESLEPFTLVGLPEVTRLMQGGVYLITGGTGGIGLAVAEHLAAAFKARLVLVSRSVQVREEDWGTVENNICFTEAERKRIRKLKEIRSLGGGLLVAKGDVTDIEQMKAIVKLATEQFGGVDGVVHAAGVLDDGPLLLKTAAGAKRVLDAKVRGTLVLDEVFRDTPLHFFVLFSSISSILPAAGQVDYAAANAFLDAFAASRRGKITVVNWGGWRDAGMAARAGSLHPLLQEVLHSAPGEITCGSRLTAQTAWVLAEHRLKTDEGPRYLMPGTAFMEMAVAAFLRGARRSAIEFRDVLFIAPFMLDDGESRDVRVEVKRYPDDAADERSSHFKVFSRRKNWIEHCSGKISACALRPEKNVDRAAILGRCVDRRIVFDDRHRTRQEQYLEFGGRWHSLRSLHIGRHEGLAEIELHTQFAADVIGYRMHPALLDLATGVSLYLIKEYEDTDDLFLPISYKRLRLYSSLPAKFFSHIRWREQSAQRGPVATFDITVFDAEGYVRVEIEGFSMRRIEDRRMAIQEKLEFTGASGSQTGLPVQAEDRQGIDPHDGVRALVRILSVRLPDGVVAVAAPLSKLDERKPAASHGATGAKTSLTGETFEDAIAAWWQEMLGVKKVGPDDDFFDLGGHSLVGVRFLAAVRKAYGVDLDLDVLFEARTVRGMAEVISKLERGARES